MWPKAVHNAPMCRRMHLFLLASWAPQHEQGNVNKCCVTYRSLGMQHIHRLMFMKCLRTELLNYKWQWLWTWMPWKICGMSEWNRTSSSERTPRKTLHALHWQHECKKLADLIHFCRREPNNCESHVVNGQEMFHPLHQQQQHERKKLVDPIHFRK